MCTGELKAHVCVCVCVCVKIAVLLESAENSLLLLQALFGNISESLVFVCVPM